MIEPNETIKKRILLLDPKLRSDGHSRIFNTYYNPRRVNEPNKWARVEIYPGYLQQYGAFVVDRRYELYNWLAEDSKRYSIRSFAEFYRTAIKEIQKHRRS